MDISIFGLGYVGAVSLGCLARDGHRVIGVDVDESKLELIRSGTTPIVEEGMEQLIRDAASGGRVSVTTTASEALAGSSISFVCVGTPGLSNGSQDLTAIRRLSEQLGAALKDKDDKDAPHLVVIRSTVFPGTLEEVIVPILEQQSGMQEGEQFDVCFQPEFLREGSSIKDYDNPPFTVVGSESARVEERMRELFGHLPCELLMVPVRTAEMMKYGCNIFHAVKVTFANEIGRLSQALGVDPHSVMSVLCKDTRLNISPAYMKPGFAFGGSCLPKDLKAMLYVAKSNDVAAPMLSGVLPSNRSHIDLAIDHVLSSGKRNVAMVGLSFKSGTDDLRESPLVTMAEQFIGKGLNLKIYDPEVSLARIMGANRRYIETTIPHIASLLVDSCDEMVEQSEVVVVGLDDANALDALQRHSRPDQLILDLVNIPDKDKLRGRYQGVCW